MAISPKKKQGIYNKFFRKQEGACALCGRTDLELFLDHDHGCCPGRRPCGKCYRGLLCHGCNVNRMADFDAALKGALLVGERTVALIVGYYPREAEYMINYVKMRSRHGVGRLGRSGIPPARPCKGPTTSLDYG